MTTSSQTPYKAPDGFYKNYTFDKDGKVFADGKELSGVQLDIGSVKPPPEAKVPGIGGLTSFYNNSDTKPVNPYGVYGGNINRLSVDNNGNIFAEVGSPNTPALANKGNTPTKGPNGLPSGAPIAGPLTQSNDQPLGMASIGRNLVPTPRIQLTGIGLDPTRTSRNSGGDIGANDAYLRQDQDGLYFAQVNKGKDVVAYGYSKYQTPTLPTGGPAQPVAGRRQGGNAGGGVSPDSTTGVSLLGS